MISALITLIGVSIFIFLIIHLIPGDPAAQMLDVRGTPERIAELRQTLGLDRPLPVQYYSWATGLLQGDLGRSFRTNRPVSAEIGRRIWPTVQLAVAGIVLAVIIGTVAGVIAAAKRDTWIESLVMIIAMLGISVPNFVFGMVLILLFSIRLGWFPTMGYGSLRHLVLPTISLGFLYAAVIARIVRSSMVEILSAEFIRVARAKGLSNRTVLYKHALRNSLIPLITVAGMYLGVLLGGTIVVESLFSWPGLGRLAVEAILTRDYPLIQGIILVIATGFVFINLVVDLAYGFVDPRIRYD